MTRCDLTCGAWERFGARGGSTGLRRPTRWAEVHVAFGKEDRSGVHVKAPALEEPGATCRVAIGVLGGCSQGLLVHVFLDGKRKERWRTAGLLPSKRAG
jgi:hypothetical protein